MIGIWKGKIVKYCGIEWKVIGFEKGIINLAVNGPKIIKIDVTPFSYGRELTL